MSWLVRLLRQARSDLENNSRGIPGEHAGGPVGPGQSNLFRADSRKRKKKDVDKKDKIDGRSSIRYDVDKMQPLQ